MGCCASRHPHPASAQQRSRRGRLPAPPSRTWSDQCSRRTHSSRRHRLSTCCRHQCMRPLLRPCCTRKKESGERRAASASWEPLTSPGRGWSVCDPAQVHTRRGYAQLRRNRKFALPARQQNFSSPCSRSNPRRRPQGAETRTGWKLVSDQVIREDPSAARKRCRGTEKSAEELVGPPEWMESEPRSTAVVLVSK